LQQTYDEALSNFDFSFNLRRYTEERAREENVLTRGAGAATLAADRVGEKGAKVGRCCLNLG
jgi:hypothetical protein